MARRVRSSAPGAESLPDHLVAVESLLNEWSRGSTRTGPLADAVAAYCAASAALRGSLQAGVLGADPDAATLAALPLIEENDEGAGPRALVALARSSRAIETVLKVRGFSVVRCAPAQVVERAREALPALVVLDPFSEPEGWARLYEWRRDSRLAHTEVLLVRLANGREDAPLGDAAFLARPLGRGDLSTRVRALLAGRATIARAVVAAVDDSCQRLETLLSVGGTAVSRVRDAGDLSAAVAAGADVVFTPFVFDGLPPDQVLARIQPNGTGPRVVFLIGPGDADSIPVTEVGERLAPVASRPLGGVLDDLVDRVVRAEEAHGPGTQRGVLPMRVFLTVFERVLDYVARHGRRMLVLRVGFESAPDGGLIPDDVWQTLGFELAERFRLYDQVTRSRSAGVLVLLADAAPEQMAGFQTVVFEPVHRLLADRYGKPLPPFAITTIRCPDEARDVPSLLARLA